MKTRLFIGNLAKTVTESELREKFEGLIGGHQNEAEVGNVEVRCKNEDNYFGYVDVHLKGGQTEDGKPPPFLRKCIDLMNNTKWRGSLIKVQVAKESFIDKLRRERGNPGSHFTENDKKSNCRNRGKDDRQQTSNFVKEFVNDEKSRNHRQAGEILNKLNRSNQNKARRHNANGLGDKTAKFDFEIVNLSSAQADSGHNTSKSSPKPKPTNLPTKAKRKKMKAYKSDSSDSEDDGVRDGIPKFKGLLLSYPDGLPEAKSTVTPEKVSDINEKQTLEDAEAKAIQQKLLNIALEPPKKQETSTVEIDKRFLAAVRSSGNENEATTKSLPKSGINFKKTKQQKSDQLRMQSLEKMKELKTQRKNLIKSSLSSVTASAPPAENKKVFDMEADSERERPKMTLFEDDDDENDEDEEEKYDKEGDHFKIRKQFEGAHGGKLLELQTRWGNDDRFKIDDRFKESSDENDGGSGDEQIIEKEKKKQLDILSGIIGKDPNPIPVDPGRSSKKRKSVSMVGSLSSVIVPRYDPEAEEEEANEIRAKSDVKENKERPPEKKKKQDVKEDPKPTIISSEPATYKTASNLKEMFSSGMDNSIMPKEKNAAGKGSAAKPGFSLLATFGSVPDEDDEEEESQTRGKFHGNSTSSGPRSFWQSNPFRYDSSDDEADSKKEKTESQKKKTPEEKLIKPPATDLVVRGKVPFFFTKNDKRFVGLEDFFLKPDNNVNAVNDKNQENGTGKENQEKEDFSIKRQELKAIVKAKIRNTKRKDEKRTLAIKRAMRKRKMRRVQQNKK